MAQRHAFVDAGYLRSKFYSAMDETFGEVPDIDFHKFSRALEADRIFWYDCAPDCGEKEANAEKLWAQRQLEKLKRTDGFLVRLGTLSRSGTKKKVNQKEVDVLLAVELLSNSYRGNMKEAYIITGDLDFRPAIEEVVRHGTRVCLCYDQSGFAAELGEVVDKRKTLNLDIYLSWCSDFASSPAQYNLRPAGTAEWGQFVRGPFFAEGTIGQCKLSLYGSFDEAAKLIALLIPTDHPREFIVFERKDARFLLRYRLPQLFGSPVRLSRIERPEVQDWVHGARSPVE